MANPEHPAQAARPAVSATGKAFADMSSGEKVTFLVKAMVMLISGGFVYPNIFVE